MDSEQIAKFTSEMIMLIGNEKGTFIKEGDEYATKTSVSLTFEQAYKIRNDTELYDTMKNDGWLFCVTENKNKKLCFAFSTIQQINHDKEWEVSSDTNKLLYFKHGLRVARQKQLRDDVEIKLGIVKPTKTTQKVENLANEKAIKIIMTAMKISYDEAKEMVEK